MTTTRVTLASVALAGFIQALAGIAVAQDRPDFSGRWTIVPEDSVIQGREGPITVSVLGTDFTVQNQVDALVIRVAPELTIKWRVNLDGSPTLHAKTWPDGRLVRTRVTPSWNDQTLILQMAEEVVSNGQSVVSETQRRFTLNPDHTLLVEMPDGAGGPLIGSVYRWLEAVR